MTAGGRLEVAAFLSPSEPLSRLGDVPQAAYVRNYLGDLRCGTVVVEPVYFDRDYLSEYQAFYSTSTRAYGNQCRRAHFFAGSVFDRAEIERALSGDRATVDRLRNDYLGFVVLRPIPGAPLGRTVLRWYPDTVPGTPRVTFPSRPYAVHLAGIDLQVTGLAWQQQDQGVGACATIALWSMLHSSAFDDHHAIPSTADITRFAHRTASLGARVFPTTGLGAHQILEAVKECGLAPVALSGDVQGNGQILGFSRERFASACASLVRSGYPVLLLGRLEPGELHAVCVVGFRECATPSAPLGQVTFLDAGVPAIYVHDDNIGPSVREEITEDPTDHCVLIAPTPPRSTGRICATDPTAGYPKFRPLQMVVGTHEDLRTSPDDLHRAAFHVAAPLARATQLLVTNGQLPSPQSGVTLSTRFLRVSNYVGAELGRLLATQPSVLATLRLHLMEDVEPMSLHIGVARFGMLGAPVLDVVYDTTDSVANLRAFCYVAYSPVVAALLESLRQLKLVPEAPQIRAFQP